MGNITKNFSRHEFACRCGCGLDSMDYETVKVLQEVCDHFSFLLLSEKVTCIINSACRCYEYNRLPVIDGGPGSTDGSQHPRCRAVDFKIVGVNPVEIYSFLNGLYSDRYGLGLYQTFVHLDTRTNGPARW